MKSCKHGHPLTPENVFRTKDGVGCRRCRNEARRKWGTSERGKAHLRARYQIRKSEISARRRAAQRKSYGTEAWWKTREAWLQTDAGLRYRARINFHLAANTPDETIAIYALLVLLRDEIRKRESDDGR